MGRRAKLAHEIRHVSTQRYSQTQCRPLLLTLTIRHEASDPVAICRLQRDAFRKFVAGRAWRRYRERDGGLEYIVAQEVTRGRNGWHPHIHVLLLPAGECADLEGDEHWHWNRWADIVERELGPRHTPDMIHGADLRPCKDSEHYISKLGLELADPAAVKGRAPLALVQAAMTGEPGALESYVQLQTSRHRCRDVTWSTGLRELRDTLPPPPPAANALELRGSEYGRLAAKGADALLDVLGAAPLGEAQRAAEWHIGPLESSERDDGTAPVAAE